MSRNIIELIFNHVCRGLALAKICSGVLTHTKGLASCFQASMNRRMVATSMSTTLPDPVGQRIGYEKMSAEPTGSHSVLPQPT